MQALDFRTCGVAGVAFFDDFLAEMYCTSFVWFLASTISIEIELALQIRDDCDMYGSEQLTRRKGSVHTHRSRSIGLI
jgi:hypothetical protein